MTRSIEQIMRAKSFDELSKEELVLIYKEGIDEAEYAHFRQLLVGADQVFDQTPPLPPALEGQLMEAYRQQHPESTLWAQLRGLIAYQIPVWQPAIAAMILLFAAPHLLPKEVSYVDRPVEKVVYVNHVDTVFKEIEVPVNVAPGMADKAPKQKIIVKKEVPSQIANVPKARNVATRQSAIIPDDLDSLLMVANVNYNRDPFEKTAIAPEVIGRSATNDSSLMNFLVEIY